MVFQRIHFLLKFRLVVEASFLLIFVKLLPLGLFRFLEWLLVFLLRYALRAEKVGDFDGLSREGVEECCLYRDRAAFIKVGHGEYVEGTVVPAVGKFRHPLHLEVGHGLCRDPVLAVRGNIIAGRHTALCGPVPHYRKADRTIHGPIISPEIPLRRWLRIVCVLQSV